MKLSTFLCIVSSVTLCAVLYVNQQSEIFRYAYIGQKKSVQFQELLDKNTVLRYTIESKASLTRIGGKISSEKDYEMPAKCQLVKVARVPESMKLIAQAPRKQNFLVKILSVKRQAEARTINP